MCKNLCVVVDKPMREWGVEGTSTTLRSIRRNYVYLSGAGRNQAQDYRSVIGRLRRMDGK